jgi:hypothetical protein
MSFVADIVILTVYGDRWAEEKHQSAFSMAIIIVNLFVKAVALLVIILIYGEMGNSRTPLQYYHHYQQQQQQHDYSNVNTTQLSMDDDEQQHLGLNDTSIVNEEGVPTYGQYADMATAGPHVKLPVAHAVDMMYGSGYQTEAPPAVRTSM